MSQKHCGMVGCGGWMTSRGNGFFCAGRLVALAVDLNEPGLVGLDLEALGLEEANLREGSLREGILRLGLIR